MLQIQNETIEQIEKAINQVSEQDGDQIIVRASKERLKIDAINPFVLCFHNSLYEIIQNRKLSRASILLLFKLLDLAAMGNLLSINQRGLARALKTSPSAMSRQMKELKNANLLIEVDFGLFLNPQVISKGSLDRLAENDPLASHAIALMQSMGMEVNHGTLKQLEKAGVEVTTKKKTKQ